MDPSPADIATQAHLQWLLNSHHVQLDSQAGTGNPAYAGGGQSGIVRGISFDGDNHGAVS